MLLSPKLSYELAYPPCSDKGASPLVSPPTAGRASLFSRVFLAAALAWCVAQPAARANDLPNPETAIWGKVKRSLFENRTVSSDARGVIELVAPVRAEDAAV